ncbi:probable polyol transporter 6 [Pistacia vera]|uniref:probable polyol transporter 6 n=1 Tax=Pistacia vera TaxID=55513 RepID=UPI001262B5B1|nr:probable polyol transporter 6 [Pistacia vera]XP_031269410.1 probable polyol transporter 6 [Pistacia vera]
MEVKPNALESNQPPRKSGFNKYVLLCSLLASTNSILLGYDTGVMSGAVLYIKDYMKINSVKVEILVGSLNVCSLIGSLLSGKTSDLIGRRYTIVLAAMTFLVGAIVMGLAPNYGILLAGRLLAGVAVGYALMIAPLYTSEIAPPSKRGFLTSLPEFFIVMGILLGYIVNYILSDLPPNINWRLMLGIAALPSVIILFGVIIMPESPRWLVGKDRIDQAREVLIKISDSPQEAEFRLEEIVKVHKESKNKNTKGVWKEILIPTPAVRRMLVAAIGINFFMQASGNDAVIYYTPQVLKAAGIHNKKFMFGVNVIMGLSKTGFVLISAIFLDRFGRQPLLFIGTTGMVVSLAVLGAGSKVLENSTDKPLWAIVMSIIAVCADVSFFSIGLGPITWVYSTEIFPSKIRAQASGLAISVNRLVSGAVAMSFLSISEAISFGGMFFVLSGIMVVANIHFYFFLPETKGKTLEEMVKIFEKNDSKQET